MDKKGYEYDIIIEKAKKLTNSKKAELHLGRDTQAASKARLEELHETIHTLQQNNTFTVEHPQQGNVAKRQFRQAAKKVVSSALLPAMQRQTLYNESASKSILELTILAQDMYDHVFRNKAYTINQVQYIKRSISRIERSIQQMEQRLDTLPAMGMHHTGGRETYAPSGEDVLIDSIFQMFARRYPGTFYLDLGAHYTYYAYLHGATGVLVTPDEEYAESLRRIRVNDVVMQGVLGAVDGQETTVYVMSNGMHILRLEAARAMCDMDPELFITREIQVQTLGINEVVAAYANGNPAILCLEDRADLLEAFDFSRYRPLVVVVDTDNNSDVIVRLQCHGYEQYAFTGANSVFYDIRQGGAHA